MNSNMKLLMGNAFAGLYQRLTGYKTTYFASTNNFRIKKENKDYIIPYDESNRKNMVQEMYEFVLDDLDKQRH